MIEYEKAYRQGEILFFKVKDHKRYNCREAKLVPSGVIRVGEKEGHEHKVEGQAQLGMFDEDNGVLKAMARTKITHPEHDDLNLPKGEYIVKTQKEATGKNTKQSVKD